jgi:23S rRNA pseudouridine2605 synthase
MERTHDGRGFVLKERLQKILSRAGVASRRKAEEMIAAGRVRVNGKVVREPGTTADIRTDRIEADGTALRPERLRYFLFHKPDRTITSVKDPQGRRTVLDFFPRVTERIFPVGRLDYHSEGLLLLTNDGDLDYILTHPSKGVPKVYEVTVRGKYSETLAAKMARGVNLPDGRTAPCEIEVLSYDETRNRTHLRMTLHEGKNREIRRMMEMFHYPVFALKRVQYSFLTLDGVAKGTFRRLSKEEVQKLYELYR